MGAGSAGEGDEQAAVEQGGSYQGRSTIPGYAAYFERLARVPLPHKVALVAGGDWRKPPGLRRDPLFRGYVVFLVNPAPLRSAALAVAAVPARPVGGPH